MMGEDDNKYSDVDDEVNMTKEEYEERVESNPYLKGYVDVNAKKYAARRKWIKEHGDVFNPDWW